MAELVYLLCLATSGACAALLVRSYLQSRSRLLLWSSCCFAGLALNNALLFVDLALLPEPVDLTVARSLVALAATSALIYGLVRDVQ